MAGPDDPPDEPPAPPGDEPRAGDVARAKSTADLEEKLDPATIAQLAKWFDLPSFAELEERQQAAEHPPLDEAAQARLDRHEAIAKIADETILSRMEGRKTAGDALVKPLPPLELNVGREILSSDPTWSDRASTVAEPREVNLPMWLEDIHKESAPQAILRDLHRPELDFYIRFEYGEQPRTIGEVSKDLHTDIRASRKVTLDVPPSWTAARDAFAELRHWKAARWDELPLPKKEQAES